MKILEPYDIKPLIWKESSLAILDQRLLPFKVEYIECFRASDVIECIQKMMIRGTSLIGLSAAYAIVLEALLFSQFDKKHFYFELDLAFQNLQQLRPTGMNLTWSLTHMSHVWRNNKHLEMKEVAQLLLQEAISLQFKDLEMNLKIAEHGSAFIQEGHRVLTYCNTGIFATGGHGTALGVIRTAYQQGKKIHLMVCETRPMLQGARLTTWEMILERIPVTLITDNAVALMMQQSEIDVVIVGADRVAKNGDLINKVGTYMLAILAKYHQIPFYVVCPSYMIDTNKENGSDIEIEERSSSEIFGFRQFRWTPEGVLAKNPAFDLTPRELITAIITEKGLY